MAHPRADAYPGGEHEFELDANNILQLLRALGERYPNPAPTPIAIDGEISQDALLAMIPPEAEVHVIPQIFGG
jgi:hypothetical protein